MIEIALIVVAVVGVVVWLVRDRGEVPPPATLEGGGSHVAGAELRPRKRRTG